MPFLLASFIALWGTLGVNAAPFPECLHVRCALDIGSSAIKMQVARVDACNQTVLKTLDSSRHDAAFADGAERLAKVIQGLQKQAKELGAEPCRGVATEAYRKPGGQALATALEKATHTPIEVVPQKLEGELELAGALARAPLSSTEMGHAVVWGLGSTSQQFTPLDHSAPVDLKFSSLGFRDRVMEKLGRKAGSSPNPLTTEEVATARNLADTLIDEAKLSPALRAKLASPEAVVVGIGGVLNLSVKKQTGGHDRVTLAAIQKAITSRVGQKDDSPLFFGREHAATQLTNLILAESFLRKLAIHEVRVVDADLTDGALVHPQLWK